MLPKYKFYLHVGQTTAAAYEIHPVWKDDLSVEWKLESQQMFFRSELSGSIDLIRTDYDYVMGYAFGTVFYLEIRISDNGDSYTPYWWGRFTLTDCKVNVDDKILTVKPQVHDDYTEILAGMEKEFNLLELKPAIERILVRKRPCLQIYTEGDDTVSCIFGNMSFEQDASIPSGEDNVEEFLRSRCHFGVVESFAELNFYEYEAEYASYFAGPFTGQLADGEFLTSTDDTLRIKYWEKPPVLINGLYEYTNGLSIFVTGQPYTEANVKWKFEQSWVQPYGMGYKALPLDITFESQVTGVANVACLRSSQTVYARIVCNTGSVGIQPSMELYNDDLVGYNRNYRRACPTDVTIYTSTRSSVTPTEWGRRDDGKYFLPPDDVDEYMPIGQSRWVNVSLWFKMTADFSKLESMGTDAYMLNDAFPLWSVLQVLLAEVAPDVNFGDSSTFSQFLYSSGYGTYSDPITGRDCRLYITPKSNITAGEYQTPAQKAPITLKTLLAMLRDTYRCYWFIENTGTQKNLRIEHVLYFMNGGRYTGSQAVGIDLTTMANKRNGKAWGYGVNSYEFEKLDMPERYQFEWMDEVTALFKGNPIEVDSTFVELGKIEEINVSQFTSDIDYMLLNPSGVSPEGFAVMTVETANALSPVTVGYDYGEEGAIIAIARYVWGKTCVLAFNVSGTGGMALKFWYGSEVEDSGYNIYASGGNESMTVDIPEGVTGISFGVASAMSVTYQSLTVYNDTDSIQVPMISTIIDGVAYKLQNGWLSFYFLQSPYWKYNMPARNIRINGTVPTGVRVSRMKKQTVSVPMGLTDPDLMKLVTTAIGNGQIQQASIRLTSRMAKIQLRYDTE